MHPAVRLPGDAVGVRQRFLNVLKAMRILANDRFVRSAALLAILAYGLLLAQFDPGLQLVQVSAAVFTAAAISSVAGFAFSAICGAILFHLIDDPVAAVQTMMICSIVGQSYMVWWLRRQVEWGRLSVFLAGAAVGLPVGVWILFEARGMYVHGVGLLLVAYATFMLWRPRIVVRRQHPLFDATAGLLGGITGGAVAFPGAFVTIWCGLKGWTKERQRALYQPFILLTQVAALLLIVLAHPATGERLSVGVESLLFMPPMLLGTSLGLTLFRRLSDGHFGMIVNLMLIASGLSLLF
jgi:uncharacterized membrane protein YfcA